MKINISRTFITNPHGSADIVAPGAARYKLMETHGKKKKIMASYHSKKFTVKYTFVNPALHESGI